MLKKIILKGFQSHENTSIELVNGINVLIGTSNSGKTAILRGLYWTLNNRPLGDGFIQENQDSAEVFTQWQTSKNQELNIVRYRDKSKNFYILNDLDPFDFFGTKPPQAITEALNLSDINIQQQFSPYFLVFESPGSVANYIRSITGLEEIEKVSKNLTTQINTNNSSVKKLEQDLIVINEKLEKLEIVPTEAMKTYINSAKELNREIQNLNEKRERLIILCSQIKSLEEQSLNISEEEIAAIDLSLKTNIELYEVTIEQQKKLNKIITDWKNLEDSKKNIPDSIDFGTKIQENYISNLKSLKDLSEIIKDWNSVTQGKRDIPEIQDFGIEIAEKYLENTHQLNNLNNLLKSIIEIEEILKTEQLEIQAIQFEESQLLSQVDICPYCDSTLNEETKNNLLSKVKL